MSGPPPASPGATPTTLLNPDDPNDPHAGQGEAYNPSALAAAAGRPANPEGLPTGQGSITWPSVFGPEPAGWKTMTPEQQQAELIKAITGGGGSTTTTTAQKVFGEVDPTIAAGYQKYFEVWGVKPPRGYIETLVKAGLNADEILAHELSKPAALSTHYWRDSEATAAQTIAQAMGKR